MTTRSKAKEGSKNPQWKGDNVGYGALHDWVRNHKPKPEFCEICGIKPPRDLANISGEYKRDINDFEWLCRKCHSIKDDWLSHLNTKSARQKKSNSMKGNKNACGAVRSEETRRKMSEAKKLYWLNKNREIFHD